MILVMQILLLKELLLLHIQIIMRMAKKVAFRSNAPFISCISKINNTLIDNAEYLDIVIPKYNSLEYSKNCSKTTVSFWNYYRDELNSGANNNINCSAKD